MKISVLIPCHNEEKGIKACVDSCLRQTRRPDEVIVVDDGSTDGSAAILKTFGTKIKVITLPEATGNKSYAQEEGLKYLTGDIFVTTDGDTMLHPRFIEEIEEDFKFPDTIAVCGYVKSLRYNWLTACRELEYVLSQNLYKKAQAFIRYVYVIPGCAGAFRTKIFKEQIAFDHDTVTEDLDFTYKLHEMGHKVRFNWHAIVYTQDPFTLESYMNQMRRWYGGGWQNLVKHWRILKVPQRAMELSLIYVDAFLASLLLFIVPLIDIVFFVKYLSLYLIVIALFGAYAAIKDRRLEVFLYSPFYLIIIIMNAWVFVEQFVREVLFRRGNLHWFQPERATIQKP